MLSPPLGTGMDLLLLEIEPGVIRAGTREGWDGKRERGEEKNNRAFNTPGILLLKPEREP